VPRHDCSAERFAASLSAWLPLGSDHAHPPTHCHLPRALSLAFPLAWDRVVSKTPNEEHAEWQMAVNAVVGQCFSVLPSRCQRTVVARRENAEGRGEDAAQARPEDGVMLPQVLPMLAVAAEPFDAPECCFEIKYDGVRALAAVDEMGWRLWGRERADYTARYPELEVLRRLPAGTLVDGELVAFDAAGRPELRRLLRRHALTDWWRIRQARHWCPVRYVLFDLLFHAGRCLMRVPLVRLSVVSCLPMPNPPPHGRFDLGAKSIQVEPECNPRRLRE